MICGCGETGRRAGFRFLWETIWVRVPSSAPTASRKGCFFVGADEGKYEECIGFARAVYNGDALPRVRKAETADTLHHGQIRLFEGCFFVGADEGKYEETISFGKCLHFLWRSQAPFVQNIYTNYLYQRKKMTVVY